MSDLISRQAAIDAIFSEPLYESGMKKRDADEVVPAIYEKIKAMPPVQTEIIHCKDCAFYEKEIGGNDGFALGMCRFIEQHYVTNEGFCFWAKKRGDLGGTD